MPDVSIIIVNWNSLEWLRDCLSSVYATTESLDFEVVVVDNASADAEALRIQELFPHVKVVCSEENLGFARANNLGVREAKAAYLLFLNPDTKILGPAIDTMLGQLKSLPQAAIIGCTLLNADGSIQTSCIQRFPTIANQVFDVEYLRLRWPHWKIWGISPLFSSGIEPAEVEVISGACLMIRRDFFEQEGGFDTRYPMYAEDADLCYRVRQQGGKAFYVSEARVIHYGGGSSRRQGSQWATVMQRRGILRFFRATRGTPYALAYRAAMGASALCRLAAYALLYPFRGAAYEARVLHSDSGKWLGVLKWAIGFEPVASWRQAE
jgi:GT2 family glycosyltransferase